MKFEEDTQWLIERFGDKGLTPTPGQIDFFIEKVAVMEQEVGMTEETARLSVNGMIKL